MPETNGPGPLGRRKTVTIALGFVGVVVLGLVFHLLGQGERVNEPSDLDNFIHHGVVRHRPDWPWLTRLFHSATAIGDPPVAVTTSALVTLGLLGMGRRGVFGVKRNEGWFWVGTILGGQGLNRLFKWVYQRERPPLPHRLVEESSFSFPSGHSVFAAVFFALMAAELARAVPRERPWLRGLAVATCLVLAALVGLSRVWLGVHYPTDVIGGLLLGFAWVGTVVLVRRARELRAEVGHG